MKLQLRLEVPTITSANVLAGLIKSSTTCQQLCRQRSDVFSLPEEFSTKRVLTPNQTSFTLVLAPRVLNSHPSVEPTPSGLSTSALASMTSSLSLLLGGDNLLSEVALGQTQFTRAYHGFPICNFHFYYPQSAMADSFRPTKAGTERQTPIRNEIGIQLPITGDNSRG